MARNFWLANVFAPRTTGSLAGLALAVMAPPAFAQVSDEMGAQLDEIVVTARKVEENLQDVPVAVTAFTGEQLRQQNAVRVSDVARLTPGLSIREGSNNPSGVVVSLRAQVQTDTLATLDPSVGTYVDGFYWARAYGLNADLVDLRSAQVLKGPQGTLFGRNTTGGAILFETNDPDPTGVSGMAQATFGEFNERVLSAVLNMPLVEDRAALRFAVQENKRDGYLTDRLTGREYGDRDNLTARLKFLVQPTDTLSILLSGELYDMSQNGPARVLAFARQPVTTSPTQPPFSSTARTYASLFPLPGGPTLDQYIGQVSADPDSVALSDPPYTDVETQTLTGTVTWDTSIGTVKLIGGHRKIDAYSLIDLDGSPWQTHVTTGEQSLEHWSTELQVTGEAMDDRLKYAAGAFYFEESGVDRSFGFQVPRLSTVANQFLGDIDNDSKGVYAQATWSLTDALNFTGGLRYSVDRKGIEIRNVTLNRVTGAATCTVAGAVPPDCALSRSDEFDGLSYTAGLDYNVTDDVLVYVKTGKGFRSGGQNLRATSPASFVPFQPETVYEHEIGLKSQLFDRRMRLNIAAYHSTLKDAQRSTLRLIPATGGTTTLLENAAEVKIWGGEAELTAILFDGFEVSATGSLTNPQYEEYREAPSPQNPTGDRSHERFDAVPESTFSVAASYKRDLEFGRLMLRADYAWQDETALNAWNNPLDPNNAAIIAATTQPAGGVVNARAALSFADDRYEIAVWGRNLGDNRDIVSALLVDPFGYVSVQRREPMTFGVTGTARFGGF